MIKARFYVAEITKQIVSGGDTLRQVTMRAVTRETDDNITWAKYTPGGEIKMSVNADGAGQAFDDLLGKDVSVTFEEIVSR